MWTWKRWLNQSRDLIYLPTIVILNLIWLQYVVLWCLVLLIILIMFAIQFTYKNTVTADRIFSTLRSLMYINRHLNVTLSTNENLLRQLC